MPWTTVRLGCRRLRRWLSPRRGDEAKPADPCAMVIFGATGDLTKRLVIPALYNLSRTKVLPEQFALIGVARAEGNRGKLARPPLRHAEKLCRQRLPRSSMSTTSTRLRGSGLRRKWCMSGAT